VPRSMAVADTEDGACRVVMACNGQCSANEPEVRTQCADGRTGPTAAHLGVRSMASFGYLTIAEGPRAFGISTIEHVACPLVGAG